MVIIILMCENFISQVRQSQFQFDCISTIETNSSAIFAVHLCLLMYIEVYIKINKQIDREDVLFHANCHNSAISQARRLKFCMSTTVYDKR